MLIVRSFVRMLDFRFYCIRHKPAFVPFVQHGSPLTCSRSVAVAAAPLSHFRHSAESLVRLVIFFDTEPRVLRKLMTSVQPLKTICSSIR